MAAQAGAAHPPALPQAGAGPTCDSDASRRLRVFCPTRRVTVGSSRVWWTRRRHRFDPAERLGLVRGRPGPDQASVRCFAGVCLRRGSTSDSGHSRVHASQPRPLAVGWVKGSAAGGRRPPPAPPRRRSGAGSLPPAPARFLSAPGGLGLGGNFGG